MSRFSWVLVAVLAATLVGKAQEYAYESHLLPEEHGFVRPELVCQDLLGLVWIGTKQGLFRFDGSQYQHFTAFPNTESEEVTALSADNGEIWVGYANGSVGYIQPHSADRINFLPLGDQSPNAPITGLAAAEDNKIWISTYGEGVLIFSAGTVTRITMSDGLPGNEIYCMASDSSGIWIGTDNGLARCNFADGQKEVEKYSEADGLPDIIVKAIEPDGKGNLWIGTHDGGICKYSPSLHQWMLTDSEWRWGEITSITSSGDDAWIGTMNAGLVHYHGKSGRLAAISYPDNYRHRKIHDLMIDQEGLLWMINSGQALLSSNLQVQYSSGIGPDVTIQAVLCGSDQRYWVGTNKGLYVFQPNSNTFERHLPRADLHIISLFEDAWGRLWIGTFGKGVLCIDPESGESKWLKSRDGLFNESVLSIDGRGSKVWLATLGGITEWTISDQLLVSGPDSTSNFLEADGLGTGYIYTVFVDSRGDVWFGTDGQGVSVLRSGALTNYSSPKIKDTNGRIAESEDLKTVYSITEDGSGNIWLSTAEDDVFIYKNGVFERVPIRSASGITCLQGIDRDHLIMAHKSGLDILHPLTGEVAFMGKKGVEGELDPHLNTGSRCPDGCALVAGQKQLVWYCPLEGVRQQPGIHIYNVLDVSLPLDTEARKKLTHRQNDLVFQYTGLWFTNPSHLIYKYRLKGHQEEWIFTKDRQAVFANLPPGSYSFEVSAAIDHFTGNEPVATLGVTIDSPYWMKWWFWITLLILASMLVYQAIRNREQRILRVNKLEKEKAESRFEALKSQINPHFLFNNFNTLVAIIEENPALAVTFTEHLSDFYRKILVHRNKSLISLEEELELVRIYGFLLKHRYGSNFEIDIIGNPKGFFLPPLALQMLVENAVKHNVISSSKPLKVKIVIDPQRGTAMVSNPLQKKLKPAESTGFGLNNIQSQFALLAEKEVKITETPNTFCVTLPLIQALSHENSHR